MRTARIITSILMLSSALAYSQSKINFENGSWAAVLEKAKKENKPIYLDCYTTWCGPCKWMSKNVFTNDTVAEFYNSQFVNVEMDMEKGEGLEIAQKYGIQAYPTLLYLNGDGKILHRSCGAAPSQLFISIGKTALDPSARLESMNSKFESNKSNGTFMTSYISALEMGCQDYNAELSAYLATQNEKDLSNRTNWNMISKYVFDYSSREFIYLENNQELFSKLYTADSVKNKIINVYSSAILSAVRKQDKATYKTLRDKIQASGTKGSEELILKADAEYYRMTDDWKNYAITTTELTDKFLQDDPMALNGSAWNFYENISDVAMLENAARWAKKSIDLYSMYANNDTYAAVLYKLGRKEEAKKAALKAIELAKASGEDSKETEELLKKIESLKSKN
jgi:thiol-disulfide isomerase/thioredoxin